jgi:ribosomal protein S18 acetylase RimI-like enzyme
MIRQATPHDARAIAEIHVDTWRSTYKGIVSDEFLENLSYEKRERQWKERFSDGDNAKFVYVVENEDSNVVGFAAGGPGRTEELDFDGEIYAIYIAQQHQRKGYGRELIKASVAALTDSGIDSMAIWVLEDNLLSRRFYESMGGVVTDRKMIPIGGVDLPEVAYGWRSLSDLF